MILYFSMLLGVLFVLLGKLNKVYSKPDFEWKIFVKTNLIATLMMVVAALILIVNADEVLTVMTSVFPSNPFVKGGLFAALCGAGGVTLLQYFIDMSNPTKKTSFGMNKVEQ